MTVLRKDLPNDAPAFAPRAPESRAEIEGRLNAFAEATNRLSEAVASGAASMSAHMRMWSSKPPEEQDR